MIDGEGLALNYYQRLLSDITAVCLWSKVDFERKGNDHHSKRSSSKDKNLPDVSSRLALSS